MIEECGFLPCLDVQIQGVTLTDPPITTSLWFRNLLRYARRDYFKTHCLILCWMRLHSRHGNCRSRLRVGNRSDTGTEPYYRLILLNWGFCERHFIVTYSPSRILIHDSI